MDRDCRLLVVCSFGVLLVGQASAIGVAPAAEPGPIAFNRDVRPVLSDKCFRCHGPDAAHREAELRLDRREDAVADRDGVPAVVPGKSAASEAYRRITATDADVRMPPPDSGLELSAAEIEVLKRWIDAGAEYEPHWAFVPPQSPALPKVRITKWPRNEIDFFVLAELERHGLEPSPEADPATLCRRLHLDLTGLPPTPAKVEEWETGRVVDGETAYAALVDKLLASPRYGERMALDWLDAARYADTNGFYTDAERNAWPWREWVIRAYNADLPFDRFTIHQLAGDLLPAPTLEQRIATGFNRNHMVTNETGIIEEEYRTGYVVDRVDTTTTVWLGLTYGCARCHDHKYDPISQREYYQLFACFNNVAETGLVKDVAPLSPAPTVSLPTPEQERRLAELAEAKKQAETQYKQMKSTLETAIRAWEKSATDKLAPTPTAGNVAHFRFDENAADAGPGRVAADVTGKLTYTTGAKGDAATFDGTQYVEFDEPAKFERDRPFSLSVWVNPGGAPSGCIVSKMEADAESRGFEIIWYKSQPRVNFVHRWGRSAIEVVAQEKFTRQWRHLAVTYDGGGRAAGLKIYIDGALAPVTIRRDDLSGPTANDEPWRIAWKATGVGFDGGLDEFRLYDRSLDAAEVEALYWREALEGATALAPADRTRQMNEKLEAFYLDRHGTKEQQSLVRMLRELRSEEEAARKEIVSASVMEDLAQRRETRMLMRGQYDAPGEAVTFDVPEALGRLPAGAPRDRLGFAEWLVSPSNPLTARVAVNRLWQQCFGEGLVRTTNDFGLQGDPPTHPELLDWLAMEFVRGGWSQKALLRKIVTSATYRQSSDFTPALLARDPENRLLGRGARYRLSAEAIRDSALAVSGLLVERIGGPSVKPYQPPGLWEAVSYNGDATYEADHGDGLYRRSLYTFWKRQSPPPQTLTFDGPTREVCTVRRPRTNTPLQALVLLNDVTYVEAARALASRMMRDGGTTPSERVRHGFRLATGRTPQDDEVATLVKLYDRQRTEYAAKPAAAKTLLRAGESKLDPSLDATDLAAWTMVAGVLLNLDEVLTRH